MDLALSLKKRANKKKGGRAQRKRVLKGAPSLGKKPGWCARGDRQENRSCLPVLDDAGPHH